jgi:hypothetical protein
MSNPKPVKLSEAEIALAPRVKGIQRAELFGDDQRRVVGQHDSARAHPDLCGGGGDVADHDRPGGAGDARHVVVLGQPVAAA